MSRMAFELDDPLTKPRLRGVLHLVAFVTFIPLALLLQSLASGASEITVTVVYAMSILAMLGTSAVYHRGNWNPVTKRRLRRLDHSMILLAIAGTYTPVAVLGLDGATGVAILVSAWVGAAGGIALRMCKLDAPPWLVAGVYLAVGWVALLALPALIGTGVAAFVLVLVGGVLYSLGAVVYAVRWPDPRPAVFGYHEVFHAFVVVAVLCHYSAVVTLVATA